MCRTTSYITHHCPKCASPIEHFPTRSTIPCPYATAAQPCADHLCLVTREYTRDWSLWSLLSTRFRTSSPNNAKNDDDDNNNEPSSPFWQRLLRPTLSTDDVLCPTCLDFGARARDRRSFGADQRVMGWPVAVVKWRFEGLGRWLFSRRRGVSVDRSEGGSGHGTQRGSEDGSERGSEDASEDTSEDRTPSPTRHHDSQPTTTPDLPHTTLIRWANPIQDPNPIQNPNPDSDSDPDHAWERERERERDQAQNRRTRATRRWEEHQALIRAREGTVWWVDSPTRTVVVALPRLRLRSRVGSWD